MIRMTWAAGVVLGWVGTAWAGVVFVDDDAALGGNGQEWGTAYRYLQDALAAAQASGGAITEIWVAAGTYKPDQGSGQTAGSRTATFQLLNGVALRGGFAGVEEPGAFDLADRDFVTNETILSGDLAGDDGADFANNGENSYHVVTGSGRDATAAVDGFTITAGNAKFTGHFGGGGMCNNVGSPTVKNCVFLSNRALVGGGMYNSGGAPFVVSCRFSKNEGFAGAGMGNDDSDPTVTDCTFEENSVSEGGGAMYNSGSSPTLVNCRFMANIVDNSSNFKHGGGMYNVAGSNPSLTNCTFSENVVRQGNGYGGAMSNNASSPTLANCVFQGNGTSSGGGMYNENGSSPRLISCTFWGSWGRYGGGMNNNASGPILINCMFDGNSASTNGKGGGMYNGNSSSPSLIGVMFTGNEAGFGGAIHNTSSSPTLVNCTLSGNSATSGAGIFNTASSPTLTNCILWGNTYGQVYNYSDSNATVTYSDVHGGWSGTGNINSDPLFIDAAGGDLRLSAGSPCIDAGDNAAIPARVAEDLASRPRMMEDLQTGNTGNPAGAVPMVDMGAYEYGWVADFDVDGDVDGFDFLTFANCYNGSDRAPLTACESPWADIDGDGDVDGFDFLTYANCYNGSDRPPLAGP